jgi:type I restriction enzyme, S subunit
MNNGANHWGRVRVGDTLRLINGAAFKPTDWTLDGLPIVRIQNLNNEQASYNRSKRDLPEKFRLRGGELLFAWSGTPGTSFGAHIWRGGEAWLNQHIFKVLFDEKKWDKKFLQFAINQNLADYIRAAHGGAGLAHITKGKFEDSEVIQPPLGEQRRIVAEIEKQFTRLDAGVVALRRVQAKLKRYRAAVLKAACEGKLVTAEAELAHKERRSFEPGEQLLKRILAERRKHWTGRGQYKEPAAPNTANLPSPSAGWTWATFDQISSLITKGSSPNWQGFNYCDEGIIFVRSENVRWGALDLSGAAHLPPAFNDKERKSILREGDVLLNLVGASIGRSAIATAEVDGGNVNQAVAVIRLVAKIEMNQFAMLWLNSSEAQKRIHAEKVDVARANFSLEDTRVLQIPLPPLAEQTRIVAEVERRLSVVEELESVVSANLHRATHLRQSILQKAFTGKL